MTCKSFFYKSVNCKFFSWGFIEAITINFFSDDFTYVQIGVVHGSVGECGDQIFPAIYAKLDDPEIFYFIEGAKEIGVSG